MFPWLPGRASLKWRIVRETQDPNSPPTHSTAVLLLCVCYVWVCPIKFLARPSLTVCRLSVLVSFDLVTLFVSYLWTHLHIYAYCAHSPPALPPKKRQSASSPTRVAVVSPMSRGSCGLNLPPGALNQVRLLITAFELWPFDTTLILIFLNLKVKYVILNGVWICIFIVNCNHWKYFC